MQFDEASLGHLLAAIRFAADKHSAQRRKNQAATPYINHPLQVMELLWRVGGVRDVDVLMAGVLHDTLEDTATTPAELEAHFGPEVRRLVEAMSDDKALPKATRKRLQIEHAPTAPLKAKPIKLADKICNVHDISHTPPVGWPRSRVVDYLDWAEQVVTGLRGSNPGLEAAFDQTLREARARSSTAH